MSGSVRVWIEEPGYEEPYYYWNTGPKPYKFTPEYEISREDYDRWESVKKAWEGLQDEIWELKKTPPALAPLAPSPGLLW